MIYLSSARPVFARNTLGFVKSRRGGLQRVCSPCVSVLLSVRSTFLETVFPASFFVCYCRTPVRGCQLACDLSSWR